MNDNYSLSVIVPFYNEEKFLEESITRLLKIEIVQQIVLVDDCSKDKSYAIGEKLVKENNNILITKTDNNLGKGGAVKAGLEQVTSTHVVVHDADLEYFPEDISEMFEAISSDQEHLILGSRTIGTKKRKNLYFYTYFGNKVFTLLFSILNNYKVSDIASCYWLVKTES